MAPKPTPPSPVEVVVILLYIVQCFGVISLQDNPTEDRPLGKDEASVEDDYYAGYFPEWEVQHPSSTSFTDGGGAPWIDPESPTNVTVVAGRTATLACIVRNLGTASVSWMRVRDYNVLTMNELTNTKDDRIRAIHVPDSDTWAVRIEETTVGDSGEYECQVTTPNKTIIIVNLHVLDPTTSILGPEEVFLSKGSTLNLTCLIQGGPNSQPFIIWTHDSKMLKYISGEAALSSLTGRPSDGAVVSQIVVAETSVTHSGLYKCEPGAAPPDQVHVHVIDGKLPAAMQTAGGTKTLSKVLAATAAAALLLRFKADNS